MDGVLCSRRRERWVDDVAVWGRHMHGQLAIFCAKFAVYEC